MALLIRNGEIVTATERFVADIRSDGERIAEIGPGLHAPPGTEVVEAAGMLVFPGFIDPHTHVHLPAMGTLGRDTYETASRAALLGGTTCFFDFCTPAPDEDPRDALATWQEKSEGKSACDYAFHQAVTRFDDRVEEQLRAIVREGIPSFKVFLAYEGTLGISDAELYRTLRLARKLGVITLAHCENAAAVAARQRELLAAGRTGPEWHHESRPPAVEADGTHHLLAFAELLDAPVYVVHLSCAEALRVALRARRRGVRVAIEVLIQHLLLDRTCAERPDFEGAKYVMSPPLRDAGNQPRLWRALGRGRIDTVATDHAPFDFADQKRMGEHDFTRIPNGLPGIEDRVNLLYAHGVRSGRIDLHRFVDAASTRPARLFGLFPRKGTIRVGADADLVVYDPDRPGTISRATHAMNVDYNPFEGMQILGRPHLVTVRGQVAVRDGRFVGAPGRGRFLRREPSHS
jgi:dihydropyrimidinase